MTFRANWQKHTSTQWTNIVVVSTTESADQPRVVLRVVLFAEHTKHLRHGPTLRADSLL